MLTLVKPSSQSGTASDSTGSYTTGQDDFIVEERNHILKDDQHDRFSQLERMHSTDLTSPARDIDRWQRVEHFAANHQQTLVLCEGGYRFAKPEKAHLAVLLRGELLASVASTTLNQIASVGLTAAKTFAETGERWTTLVTRFSAEDQESLEFLLQACATELGVLPESPETDLAKAYLPKALRRSWTGGMGILSRYRGAEPDWYAIRSLLPHALRLGNLGWRSEPSKPWSPSCRV